MMTTRMIALAPASRTSGAAGTRESAAVFIASLPCPDRRAFVKSERVMFGLDLTGRGPACSLDALMARTPNAGKSIFAFVAAISLR